jgi:hypothetical protein
MRKDREERLFGSLNGRLAELLEWWKSGPESVSYADNINAMIQLAGSAGLGIILKINKESWDEKDAGGKIPVKHWMENGVEVVQIDPPKKRVKENHPILAAYSHCPTDEFTPSDHEIYIRFQDGSAHFRPQDIESIQAF